MNLYIWIDENGQWRVTQRAPSDGSAYLQASLSADSSVAPVAFMDENANEIAIERNWPA